MPIPTVKPEEISNYVSSSVSGKHEALASGTEKIIFTGNYRTEYPARFIYAKGAGNIVLGMWNPELNDGVGDHEEATYVVAQAGQVISGYFSKVSSDTSVDVVIQY